MLEFCSGKLKSYKRELVKYAWSSVMADDSLLQNWANVNLCRFCSVFESPSKIIVQVQNIFLLLLMLTMMMMIVMILFFRLESNNKKRLECIMLRLTLDCSKDFKSKIRM